MHALFINMEMQETFNPVRNKIIKKNKSSKEQYTSRASFAIIMSLGRTKLALIAPTGPRVVNQQSARSPK